MQGVRVRMGGGEEERWRFRPDSALLADAELVAIPNRPAAAEVYLQQLLALDGASYVIGQVSNNAPGLHVDDFARGGKRQRPVDAERDPAGLIAE